MTSQYVYRPDSSFVSRFERDTSVLSRREISSIAPYSRCAENPILYSASGVAQAAVIVILLLK